MDITEVRVKLARKNDDRLLAFCSITFDGLFVVHDLKVVEADNHLFVAMPSRKWTEQCPRCGRKNHVQSRFCNECSRILPPSPTHDKDGTRIKMHTDVAHPITPAFRELIEKTVINAYLREAELYRTAAQELLAAAPPPR